MNKKNKIKRKIAMGAAFLMLLGMGMKAKAQDFYNGQKGPKGVMLDNYVSQSFQGEGLSYNLVPKVFTKTLEDKLPDLAFMAPFSISKDKIENKGINLGYVFNNIKGHFAVAALGLFKDGNGKYNVLNPQIYYNHDFGKWSFDAEGAVPVHLKNKEVNWHSAATVGYGLSDRIRIGASVIKDKGKPVDGQILARFEIKKDHQYWAEISINKKQAMVRLVANYF